MTEEFVIGSGGVLIDYNGNDDIVIIPDTVTEVGESAFRCSEVRKVVIPESVKVIGEYAFSGCDRLEYVNIPDKTVRINANAFSGCVSLKEINIPDSVYYIGYAAFDFCRALKTISLPVSLTVIPSNLMRFCTSLESVEFRKIPGKRRVFRVIDDRAFENCFALKSVNIPAGVTEIGNYAFSHCIGMTVCAVPESVHDIGAGAFYYCKILAEIRGDLEKIKIGSKAFMGCASLADKNGNVIFNGTLFMHTGKQKTVRVPDEVSVIDECAFAASDFAEEVIVPETVKTIRKQAFSSCSPLKKVTVPEKTQLEENAFRLCPGLADENGITAVNGILYDYFGSADTVRVPDGIRRIEPKAFGMCGTVEEVILPDSVEWIGEEAFKGCAHLKKAVLPSSVIVSRNMFSHCPSLENVEISPGLYDRLGYADCKKIFLKPAAVVLFLAGGEQNEVFRNVIKRYLSMLPNRMSMLSKLIAGGDTFSAERLLFSPEWHYGVDEVRKMEEWAEAASMEMKVLINDYKSKNITEKMLLENENAEFEKELGLRQKTFADWRREFVFTHRDGCVEITGLKKMSAVVSVPSVIGNCPVRKIGEGAFAGMDGVKKVVLPESVKAIGRCAFGYVFSLEEVTVRGKDVVFGPSAFYCCKGVSFRVKKGSSAERYAKAHKFPYEILHEEERSGEYVERAV